MLTAMNEVYEGLMLGQHKLASTTYTIKLVVVLSYTTIAP